MRAWPVSARELLIGACLLCAVLATLALIRVAEWTRAHWALIALLAGGLVVLALVLWHRRMMEFHRQQWATGEDWRRLGGMLSDLWACPWCLGLVAGLADAGAHMDPERSACAAYRRHLEEAPQQADAVSAPGRGWPAVLSDPEEASDG